MAPLPRRCVEGMSTAFPPVHDHSDRSPISTPSLATGEAALDALDFPAVRRALAGHVRYGPARGDALSLLPSWNPDTVAALHAETREAHRLLDEGDDLDLTLLTDPTESVTRAGLGGVLAGDDLLAIGSALRVQRRAAGLASPKAKAVALAPGLAARASQIPDLSDVEQAIGAAIGDRGEVLDAAIPGLRGLRRRVRAAYEEVTGALTGIVGSDLGFALQDSVISMRGDRFVLQVRSELRHRVPGIVHDASNTGATVYVEPLATVELGNSWRELTLEEERQTARALAELSELVGRSADDFMRGSGLTGQIDLVMARARHGARLGGITPVTPDAATGGGLSLLAARHPLLGESAVPLTIRLGPAPSVGDEAGDERGPNWTVLVVTGPNTGGKTVAMKTVGLLVAMSQAGLQVPAANGTVLPIFDALYVDVGDHQSIERSVSTFSSHMRRVIGILEDAGPRSLVLLDELGASTNPEEGAALARAVLDHLARARVPTIVTSHHRAVAAHAEATEGMENASVDLDPDTLAPTYRLTMGVPGRSYAMSVAAGLGMPRDVLDAAASYMDPKSARYEDLIEELQRERAAVERALIAAEVATESAERARIELEAQRSAMDARKGEIADAMRAELDARYADLTSRLKRAEAALSWNIGNVVAADQIDRSLVDAVKDDLRTAKAGLADLRAEAVAPPSSAAPAVEEATGAAEATTGATGVPPVMEVGALVEVRGLGVRGTVQRIHAGSGEAEVLLGDVRLRLGLDRLIPTGERSEPQPATVSASLGPALGTVELDLRGMRAEEAEAELDRFLDRAIMDGLSSVRIIHGRATGVIRRVVRDLLGRHSLVKSFSPEEHNRGGDGATRVDLT